MALRKSVLVVANVTAASDELCRELSERAKLEPAAFTLVVPATHSSGGREAAEETLVHALERLNDAGIEADGSNVTTYRIVAGQPLSAEVCTEQSAALRSGDVSVAVDATGRMTAGPATFLVTLSLDAREDGHRVHSRQWHLEFGRNGT